MTQGIDRRELRELAKRLSPLPEAEVDALLRSAGSPAVTPGDWELLGQKERQDMMVLTLAGLPKGVTEQFLGAGLGEAVGRYLAGLSESQADTLLRAAGSSRVTPGGFDAQSNAFRVLFGAVLFASSPEAVQERLLLLVDLPEESGDEPLVADGQVPDSGDGDAAGVARPAPIVESPPADGIFVVHGHAHGKLHELVRVLDATGRKVTVLHEQANAGRTILEKFEDNAAGAAYAVVLLTADDEGGAKTGDDVRPRARQNVIFELGFFFGKLGRSRVAVLLDDGVEKPSDIEGLVYVSLDSFGAWKQSLAKELTNAGVAIDYARIP